MVLKQAIIVNSDLKMSAGKMAVQVGHAEVYYMQHVCDHGHSPEDKVYKNFMKWKTDENNLMKKIVLKATELELTQFTWKLKNKVWAYPVFDHGLTQVPKDSFTCLVVEPLPEEEYNKLFRHLKLL